ncbi:hypothetical protein HK098_007736 [Nowakowskiella sp. JEL0407]|nr:hypothetical protein HK098_007736 [Nowakowskiella sp. JEL0407]
MNLHHLYKCPKCGGDLRITRESYCHNCQKVTNYIGSPHSYYLCQLCYPAPKVFDILSDPELLKAAKLSRGTNPSVDNSYVFHFFAMHPPEFSEWFFSTYIKQMESKGISGSECQLLKRWRTLFCDPAAIARFGFSFHSIAEIYRKHGDDLFAEGLKAPASKRQKEIYDPDSDDTFHTSTKKTALAFDSPSPVPTTMRSTRSSTRKAAAGLTIPTPMQTSVTKQPLITNMVPSNFMRKPSKPSTPSKDDFYMRIHDPASLFSFSNTNAGSSINPFNELITKLSQDTKSRPVSISKKPVPVPKLRLKALEEENKILRSGTERAKISIARISTGSNEYSQELNRLVSVIDYIEGEAEKTVANVKRLYAAAGGPTFKSDDEDADDSVDVILLKQELESLKSENNLMKSLKFGEEVKQMDLEERVMDVLEQLWECALKLDGGDNLCAAICDILVNEKSVVEGLKKRARAEFLARTLAHVALPSPPDSNISTPKSQDRESHSEESTIDMETSRNENYSMKALANLNCKTDKDDLEQHARYVMGKLFGSTLEYGDEVQELRAALQEILVNGSYVVEGLKRFQENKA